MLITSKEAHQIAAKNKYVKKILNDINNIIVDNIEKGSTISEISLIGIPRGAFNTILNEIENAGYAYEYIIFYLDNEIFETNITITA